MRHSFNKTTTKYIQSNIILGQVITNTVVFDLKKL